ncbi:MAG TPA: DegV family protein [Dehalococcoidia bacterium]|nr:DegV family protein [Dehalococcoidia bacterium]
MKVVTDSTSDLPPEIAEELGITIVPAYVHFGSQSYRDGVDITPEQIYERMSTGSVHPTTSSPAPGDFTEVYNRLAKETNEIVCLTVTSKQSAVYEAAMTGKQSFKGRSRVEVIDSQSVTMGLGLMAMLAAREARSGKTIDDVLEAVRSAIPRTHGMALLDTIKHALKGGRLGKGGGLLGSLVKVKPTLEIKEGWIRLCGVTRTRSVGMERLCQCVTKHLPIEDAAVVHSNALREAESLSERIRALSPQTRPVIAKLGSALGVHGGPQTLVVVVRESRTEAERAAEREGKAKRFTLPTLRIPHRQ